MDDETWGRLQSYGDWLEREAIPAGGLGPHEAAVIGARHILDSACYAAAWPIPPNVCWDLGTGVGLPGMVLALLWPRTRMLLIDRSQKRLDLVRRASRTVGVEVDTLQSDLGDLEGKVEALVSRAVIPAQDLYPRLRTLLEPGGRAVVSGSSGIVPPGYRRIEVDLPPTILAPAPRLLMMEAT